MDRSGMSFAVLGRRPWGAVGRLARRLYWPAMTAAFICPLVIGCCLPAAAGPVWQGLAAGAGLAGCTAVCQALRREEKFGPGGRRGRFPWVTMGFITVGALLYGALPETAAGGLCSLNVGEAGLGDLIRVTLARSLLHDNSGRLLANAILLGVLGLWLEDGLGPGRTLAVLALGSCVASLVSLNLLLAQIDVSRGAIRLLYFPPAGGTGAIAAFVGLGAAGWDRCRPEEGASGGIFCFSHLMEALAPLLAGIVFMGVFSGHTLPLTGPDGMAGYWGQVGGCLGGVAMAVVMRTLGGPAVGSSATIMDPRGAAAAPPCRTGDAAWKCAQLRGAIRASGGRLSPVCSR